MGRVSIDTNGLKNKMKGIFLDTTDKITKRCELYAANKLQEAYNNRTFHNDTYNLKDSYVWAVYYNNVMQNHGFLGATEAIKPQYFKHTMVIGRNDAESFLAYYTPRIGKGWEIVLAAAAPYAEYLESGKSENDGSMSRYRYIVMSYIFDEIIHDFGSANVKTFQFNNEF